MMMTPSRTDMNYGYRLRNFFTGEVICDRKFETKAEMEDSLKKDLDPAEIFGKLLRDITPEAE